MEGAPNWYLFRSVDTEICQAYCSCAWTEYTWWTGFLFQIQLSSFPPVKHSNVGTCAEIHCVHAWLVCDWCVTGVWLVRDWYVTGVWLVRDWCVTGAWLVRDWCVTGMWLVCDWCVTGATLTGCACESVCHTSVYVCWLAVIIWTKLTNDWHSSLVIYCRTTSPQPSFLGKGYQGKMREGMGSYSNAAVSLWFYVLHIP